MSLEKLCFITWAKYIPTWKSELQNAPKSTIFWVPAGHHKGKIPLYLEHSQNTSTGQALGPLSSSCHYGTHIARTVIVILLLSLGSGKAWPTCLGSCHSRGGPRGTSWLLLLLGPAPAVLKAWTQGWKIIVLSPCLCYSAFHINKSLKNTSKLKIRCKEIWYKITFKLCVVRYKT